MCSNVYFWSIESGFLPASCLLHAALDLETFFLVRFTWWWYKSVSHPFVCVFPSPNILSLLGVVLLFLTLSIAFASLSENWVFLQWRHLTLICLSVLIIVFIKLCWQLFVTLHYVAGGGGGGGGGWVGLIIQECHRYLSLHMFYRLRITSSSKLCSSSFFSLIAVFAFFLFICILLCAWYVPMLTVYGHVFS